MLSKCKIDNQNENTQNRMKIAEAVVTTKNDEKFVPRAAKRVTTDS